MPFYCTPLEVCARKRAKEDTMEVCSNADSRTELMRRQTEQNTPKHNVVDWWGDREVCDTRMSLIQLGIAEATTFRAVGAQRAPQRACKAQRAKTKDTDDERESDEAKGTRCGERRGGSPRADKSE